MGWREWVRGLEVEPSLYAADFARLGEQIETLLAAGVRIFHFDVGDAHFVPPVTIGPIVLRSIAPLVHEAGGVLDCHLMVDDPLHHLDEFASSGADSVTFHVEAVDDPGAVTARVRDCGLGVGVSFRPTTAVEAAAEAAAGADLVLCMSIEPGYSGQEFLPEVLGRLRLLRELVPHGMHVQVDGGINLVTARAAREAGANLLVAGSAIFAADDVAVAYRDLVRAVG